MNHIRQACEADLARIAEIEIFNYRLNFYPFFHNDPFYFDELQVPKRMENYRSQLDTLWVYDDGVVKGFMQASDGELRKLFVEPVLQGQSIGTALLCYAIDAHDVQRLWVLEKNVRAIAFYQHHGFALTEERHPGEDYLLRMKRCLAGTTAK